MAPPTHDWTGSALARGRYEVRAKLGEGGMGYVFRALDRNLDADVVVKAPRRAMLDDPEFAGRFASEVRSLVKLAHPNVVKVTDVGEHDGVPFAVMQYLSGGSLEDYGAAGRGADVAGVLAALGAWLPGVASALDFVHAQGYVHRDVKPGNILFDAHGHVFLSDFGVAKALAAGPETSRGRTAATGAGLVLGTPEYMAPELIMGEPFDGRIDQYALGVTVYELLAGRRPYEAASPTAVLVMQTTRPPTPLHEAEPRVPRALSDAVSAALSKDPRGRFPSCAAFAGAVVAAAGPAAAAGAATGSGGTIRPGQARRACPACRKFLVFPAALLADPEKARGKRVACPSCGARLRVADDGAALVAAAAPGASTAVHVRAPAATLKAVAPRPEAVPVARPASTPAPGPARTVAVAALTPPARSATLVERVPVLPDAGPLTGRPRKIPPWAFAAAALAVAAAFLVALVTAALTYHRPKPKEAEVGRVRIDASAVPEGGWIAVDGRAIDRAALRAPVVLAAGAHELHIEGFGVVPYRRPFRVNAGEISDLTVELTRFAPPPFRVPAPAKARPAPEAAAVARASRPRAAEAVVPPPPPQAPPSPPVFEPVSDGPEVGKLSLAELLERPEAASGQVAVPPGLYLLSRQAGLNPDGTVRAGAVRVRPRFHKDSGRTSFEPAESSLTIAVDREVARHLERHRVWAVDPYDHSDTYSTPGDTAAVLTFHVQRRTASGRSDWVPVLRKVEFLTGMNAWRVGERKYGGAFASRTVTPTQPGLDGRGQRSDWSDRLGRPYLLSLRHFVLDVKNARFSQDMQRMDSMVGNAVGSAIRNQAEQTRAAEQRIRNSFGR